MGVLDFPKLDIAMKLVIIRAMKIKANIADLKNRLSEYMKRVEEGAEISVCKRNVPIARIEPVVESGVETATDSRRPLLSEVNGWLEDDDPFFETMESRRNVRQAGRRDPFS